MAMSQRTRLKIGLFAKIIGSGIPIHVWDGPDFVRVYVHIKNSSVKRKVDEAFELVLANSRYYPGFEYYPISINLLKKEDIRRFSEELPAFRQRPV